MALRNAAVAGLGWSSNTVQLTADYVWINPSLVHLEAEALPFYYGLGVSITATNASQLALRIPLGLEYSFKNSPLMTFV